MYVHGDNLATKENHPTKYRDNESKLYLQEIREQYDIWRSENECLIGPNKEKLPEDGETLQKRVELFETYKNFLDQQHYAEKFDSRSNLHSSVLEEFMYYLFSDLVKSISNNALIGKAHSFKDIFFRADSYADMLLQPNAQIETKDHDFTIGITIKSAMQCAGSKTKEAHSWDIPTVVVECKTYLDKTMLQDVSTAADQLKKKNPNAKYIVVTEWLKLSSSVNLSKYKIDQIYVLRKQKNTDREFRYSPQYVKNPIYPDVIEHCFATVRNLLTEDWETGIAHGLDRGYLI